MSRFTNLRYVSLSGIAAPVDVSHPDNPLSGQTAIARAVSDARNRAIRWEYAGATHEFCPKYGWAALDPITDLLVVIVGSLDLSCPDNAVVINPDGTTNHKIRSPGRVELTGGENPPERYPVERMLDVYVDDAKHVVIGLNYCKERVERRIYDIANREWGLRVDLYRR